MVVNERTDPTVVFDEVRVTEVLSGALAGFPKESCNCTNIVSEYVAESAGTLGGAAYTASLVGTVAMVVMVAEPEVYPVAMAVIKVLPAVYVESNVVSAHVEPVGIVTGELTVPTSVFDVNRFTVTPGDGAFAGIPLASCSCTVTTPE